ncbi:uncharacterized protein LOC132624199 [Lycium barbarum]|uniref:uncharacterized protein LOC132624199 n=1 Tax=Lycium barbarum TaxID=112863 RepID=UPI00293E63A7|nr:uncharacterized protein LOC132624199 [Lycium barbarum]
MTSVCRTVIWTGSAETSKRALVAWEKLCLPKSAEGLNSIDNRDLDEMLNPKQASWLVREIFDVRKRFPPGHIQTKLQHYCFKGKFSIKKAYQGFKRLSTVDRLEKWGISVNKDCVLCGSRKLETMEHLWFECSYAKHMWSVLLNWLEAAHPIKAWDTKVQWLEKQVNHNRAIADILKFLFSATVYHVWNERNNRRFKVFNKESTRRLKEISIQLHIFNKESTRRLKEIAIQLHTRGNHQQKCKHILEKLNCYPT